MTKLFKDAVLDEPFIVFDIARSAADKAPILALRENIETKERAVFRQYIDFDGALSWTKLPKEDTPRENNLIVAIEYVRPPPPWHVSAGGMGSIL